MDFEFGVMEVSRIFVCIVFRKVVKKLEESGWTLVF